MAAALPFYDLMSRPLRYEAAGAVHHVMARCDGGREVFETELDRRACASHLEARAKDREASLNDAAWEELRRGWHLGPESFGRKIARALETVGVAGRKRASVGGAAFRAHDEQEALRLLKVGSTVLGLPTSSDKLAGHGRWVAEESLLVALVRRRSGVRNAWLAERLGMNHEVNVTAALRRVRESKELGKRLARLENDNDAADEA